MKEYLSQGEEEAERSSTGGDYKDNHKVVFEEVDVDSSQRNYDLLTRRRS